MKRRMKWMMGTVRIVAVTIVTLGAVGCLMHALTPHVDPSAASEFGMGPRRSAGGTYTAKWSQALGPLESPVEHGGSRAQYAHLVASEYRDEYQAIFGPLPDLSGVPAHAGPVEDPAARAAWEEMIRAFKTPSLRNVAGRAPYMHAGQMASLEEVIRHYARAPRAPAGRSELRPVKLSDREVRQLAAFLETLTGPLVAPRGFLEAPRRPGATPR